MGRVLLDDTLRARLPNLTETVALCDANGNPQAYVITPELYKQIMSSLAPPYSEAEMQRRRQETGGRSLETFWQEVQNG